MSVGWDAASSGVAGGYPKRGGDDVLPLRADTAVELQTHLANKLPDAQAFTVPARTAEMLRDDLAAARKAWIKEVKPREQRRERIKSDFLRFTDHAGRVFDFHALRGQFASSLAAGGVHPKVAQELLRHSTIGLTMDIYTHVPRGSLSAALDVLPDLTGVDAEAAQATGTHDVIADNDVGNVGAPVGATGPKTMQNGATGSTHRGTRGKRKTPANLGKTQGNRGDSRMGRQGFEPRTCGLRIRCSAS